MATRGEVKSLPKASLRVCGTGRVYATSISHGNEFFASGSDEMTVKLWKVSGCTFEHAATFKGHRRRVASLAFSLCNEILASFSHDYTIRLWNIQTGCCQATLQVKNEVDVFPSMRFSHDSKTLILMGETREYITMFRACGDGKWVEETIPGYWMAFSPNSNAFARARHHIDEEGFPSERITVCDESGAERELVHHNKRICDLFFSPDGMKLVSASLDESLVVWDLSLTIPQRRHVLTTHSAKMQCTPCDMSSFRNPTSCFAQTVSSVALSNDANRLVCASFDRSVTVWDLQGDQAVASFYLIEKGVAASKRGYTEARLSHDGKALIFYTTKPVVEWRDLSCFLKQNTEPPQAARKRGAEEGTEGQGSKKAKAV